MTLLQNDYPGWEARIDGEKVKRFRSYFTLQSVAVPPGKHTVEFIYRKGWAPVSFWLALIGFVWVVWYLVKPVNKPPEEVVAR